MQVKDLSQVSFHHAYYLSGCAPNIRKKDDFAYTRVYRVFPTRFEDGKLWVIFDGNSKETLLPNSVYGNSLFTSYQEAFEKSVHHAFEYMSAEIGFNPAVSNIKMLIENLYSEIEILKQKINNTQQGINND